MILPGELGAVLQPFFHATVEIQVRRAPGDSCWEKVGGEGAHTVLHISSHSVLHMWLLGTLVSWALVGATLCGSCGSGQEPQAVEPSWLCVSTCIPQLECQEPHVEAQNWPRLMVWDSLQLLALQPSSWSGLGWAGSIPLHSS